MQQAVVTSTGTATTTSLPGGVEEVRPDGGITKYYMTGGIAIGLNTAADASGISYLASDGLGSVTESLDGSGAVTSQQLFAPYGATRYSSGVSPTTKGFTGQRSDAAISGLDYYGARYYDPLLGQFTNADSESAGLNRYDYVRDDPESLTDPSGHRVSPPSGADFDPDLYPAYHHPLSYELRLPAGTDILGTKAQDKIRDLVTNIITAQNVKGPGLQTPTKGGAAITY